ncbi:MAG TPA: hypothetical protein PKW63_07560 [Vicinamibacterales bacterium]|nr:hypothetical protein [Acidobacteriota bacterium]HQX81598.1 hypothetical protein [Vicinamibacterales bacterium]
MKQLVVGCLLTLAASPTAFASASVQAAAQATVADVRAAAAAGRNDDAWAILDRLPAEPATVAAAVELALAPKTPLVAVTRLPFLGDRTARMSLISSGISQGASAANDIRLTACAVVVRTSADAGCTEFLDAVTRGTQGHAMDRARLWVLRRVMGEQPAALPNGWEAAITGSSAVEAASWSELPPASRVRLLEPMLVSQDRATLITALATLQAIPGPEALAIWRRLSAEGRLTYPGARNQILVGLARHGDPESVQVLAPIQGQLPVSDRLTLAQGRAERKEPSGTPELVSLVNIGAEHEALRAAEILATLGAASSVLPRVRTWVRDGSSQLRERWLAVAARLDLGATAEIVQRLTSEDEAVRLAAAVAVTAAAARRSRQTGL